VSWNGASPPGSQDGSFIELTRSEIEVLRDYEPEPLDDDARRELQRIVGNADRELRG
jgi:uncharacterized protein YqeY